VAALLAAAPVIGAAGVAEVAAAAGAGDGDVLAAGAGAEAPQPAANAAVISKAGMRIFTGIPPL